MDERNLWDYDVYGDDTGDSENERQSSDIELDASASSFDDIDHHDGSQTYSSSSSVEYDLVEEVVQEPQPSTSGLQVLLAQAVVNDSDSEQSETASNIMSKSKTIPAGKKDEPSPNESKLLPASQASDEDGMVCPICFEIWDNSGLHRLVNLKCGHLFGQSCIEKWLKGNGQRCPQCNMKARKSDIRNVYAATVKVRDTTEMEQIRRALENERASRLKCEVELIQSKAKNSKLQIELEQLKEQQKRIQQNGDHIAKWSKHENTSQQLLPSNSQKLILEQVIMVCKNGSCRVAAFLEFINMVVVSQPNNNPVFPGYGLRKINTMDFRQHEFIQIHEKPIRDVCFGNNLNGMVLTASMDKTIKLTNTISNAAVLSYSTEAPVWSCAWSKQNNFQFFAGLQNGRIALYDTRQTSRELLKFMPASSSPVVSLQHVDVSPSSSFRCCGLLVGQLDKCTFIEMELPDKNSTHILPIEGPITSVSFEPNSCHFMVSNRPNQQNKYTRHMVYEMSQISLDDGLKCNLIETYYGGETQRLLGKSRLLCNPTNEESILACGADESSNSLIIWDVSRGKLFQKLQANLPVLDICPIKSQEKHFIGTVTEKELNVFKWQ